VAGKNITETWHNTKASKGMVDMMETQYAIPPIEKAAEQNTGHCHGDNKTGADMDANVYVAWPLNRDVLVKLSRDEQNGLNKAEVLMPVENVQRFMRALIEHPLLLPTSYSQSSSVEDGKHVLQLLSKEPFADFTKRLSDAISVLDNN